MKLALLCHAMSRQPFGGHDGEGPGVGATLQNKVIGVAERICRIR
jgi:hypothetical protein